MPMVANLSKMHNHLSKNSIIRIINFLLFFYALRSIRYAIHLWLVEKPVVDFLFVIIELFCYLLLFRRYKRKSVEVGVFRRGRSL